MSPHLYENATSVCGKSGVDCLELWPPISGARISVTTIEILIPRDSSLLRGVGVVNANLCGTNEVRNLPQRLS